MATSKKCGPKKAVKSAKAKCGGCGEGLFDNMLVEFTSHKLHVFLIMASVFGLGALFSMMLGVSAAQF